MVAHKIGGRGQPRFLNVEQERELTDQVTSGRFRMAGEIRDWIESEYGVRYKPGSVYSLLFRLGCSPKVPRSRHEKADLSARESWKKGGLADSLAREGVTTDTAFGFADEMRVGLRGMVCRVWGSRGVKVCRECKWCTGGRTCSW